VIGASLFNNNRKKPREGEKKHKKEGNLYGIISDCIVVRFGDITVTFGGKGGRIFFFGTTTPVVLYYL